MKKAVHLLPFLILALVLPASCGVAPSGDDPYTSGEGISGQPAAPGDLPAPGDSLAAADPPASHDVPAPGDTSSPAEPPVDPGTLPPETESPPPASPWKTLSLGSFLTAGIGTDGTLWTWGRNDYGQLGTGALEPYRTTPAQAGSCSDWVDVAAGVTFVIAIKGDGTLWGWGNGSWGELPGGARSTPVRIGSESDWARCFAGGYSCFAIKRDGSLWAWGRNSGGILGFGWVTDYVFPQPTRVGDGTGWAEVSVGYDNVVGRRVDGTAWIWGSNRYAQCGSGLSMNNYSPQVYPPVQIGSGQDWVSVTPLLLLKADGSLWALGSCSDPSRRLVPVGTEWRWIGISGALALREDGTLWKWRVSLSGTYTPIPSCYYKLTFQLTDLAAECVQIGTEAGWRTPWGQPQNLGFLAYELDGAGEKEDGSLWMWGDNRKGQLGVGIDPTPRDPLRIPFEGAWKGVSLGSYHSLGLKADGTIWSWGSDYYGGCSAVSPTARAFGDGWSAVAAGTHNSLALRDDGSLWAWGSNRSGQLGDGGAIPWASTSPVQVGRGTDWMTVRTGGNRCYGIQRDGSLWAWGDNLYSQLGIPAAGSAVWLPTRVDSAVGWSDLCPNRDQTVAVKQDGTMWAWGTNLLSLGITYRIPAPVQVGLDSDWTTVSSGPAYTLGIKADGSLWSIFSLAGARSPVGEGKDWAEVSARGQSCLARKRDGTLWSWDAASPLPTLVRGGSGWVAIQSNNGHCLDVRLSLKEDGSLWGWGDDFNGQLGLGGSYERALPCLVATPAP